MIKIMIADDDFLVRSNIKLMVKELTGREEHESLEVVAEAGDGAEAVRLLDLVLPDIIISDIQMPKTNGLELQRYANQFRPSIKFIMLSNYDDYDYVREALKNGAVDYILKHKLSVDVLSTTINRALDMISENSNHKLSKELTKGYSLTALKRDFILSLIAGFYLQLEEIKSRIAVLGLPISEHNLVTVIMTVQHEHNRDQDAYLLENSIINIVDEILQDTHSGICCHVTEDKYIILLSYASIYSEKIRQERCFEVLSRISVCTQRYLNIKANFYQGSVVANITDIKKSYLAAEEKYRNRYYKGMEKHDLAADKPFDVLAVFDSEKERSLMAYIRSNNRKAAMDIVQDVFEELCKWSPSLTESQIVFIDLLGVLNRSCKERCIDINQIYADKKTPQEKFNEFTSIMDAKEWFLMLYERVLEMGGQKPQIPTSDYVSEAISFIHRHYAENISQTMLADHIGISPVYLSKLFKENLQIGFMEYLNHYRLEKAKMLLKQNNFSNKMVARLCGFNDDAYFSKVFKKAEGITPKEFRKAKG
jgi:two-component system response regulator YesN